MSYEPSGHLTTDEREVNDSETWDSNADWNAAQDTNNVVVESGVVKLAETDALPDSVVDNFNDDTGDPAGPYASGQDLSDYYSGDLSFFERTASDVAEGSHALGFVDNDAQGLIISAPGDGLPRYPQEGDTIRALIRAPDDANETNTFASLIHSADGSQNGYVSQIAATVNELRIRRLDSGSATTLSTQGVTLAVDTWYWVEIDTPSSGDDTVAHTLYEVDSFDPPSRGSQLAEDETTDGNYTGQGIGARLPLSTGLAGAAVDDIRVIS